MKFILSLSLLWVCFGSPTIKEQLSALAVKDSLHNINNLPLLSKFNKEWNDEGVLVRHDQLMIHMMGNRLSWYFEALACADIVGIHFAWPAPLVANDEQERKFLSSFPTTSVHPHPSHANQSELVSAMKRVCPNVLSFPHERSGAWNNRTALISEMMQKAIKAVFGNVHKLTIPRESVEYLLPADHKESQLPLIPGAAILFRCVDIMDNDVYGFVNFNVYKELIPSNVTYIYILTEKLSYYDREEVDQKHCMSIGHHLVDYLHVQFPLAVVAIRRGNAVDSVAILANAEVVVSAPSTFLLFPGIANPHKVYLMPGKLLKDQPFVRDEFYWIISPPTLYGNSMPRPHEEGAVQKHQNALTARLKKRVVVVTHTDENNVLRQSSKRWYDWWNW